MGSGADERLRKRIQQDSHNFRDHLIDTEYEDHAREIGKLVDEKQRAYGDSFHKSGTILRTLYPNGIRTDQYDDLLTIVRVIDKLFRVATDRDALGESPWRDIAGYSILASK